MGAQKAASQITLSAERVALEQTEFATGLLDLAKAFETVPHLVLHTLAVLKGYPLVILRLCLALRASILRKQGLEYICFLDSGEAKVETLKLECEFIVIHTQ